MRISILLVLAASFNVINASKVKDDTTSVAAAEKPSNLNSISKEIQSAVLTGTKSILRAGARTGLMTGSAFGGLVTLHRLQTIRVTRSGHLSNYSSRSS
jgi:hypothetical protein